MTNSSAELKKPPKLSMLKQLAAAGLLTISGLVIFLIIGLISSNSSRILNASREFDTHPVNTSPSGAGQPAGIGVLSALMPTKAQPSLQNLDLTKGFILSDHDNRLPKNFQIPEALKKETALYFDLFTKHSRESWLIVSEQPAAAIVEEWSPDRLAQNLIPPVSSIKIREFLATRISELSKTHTSLRLQQGLREDFLEQIQRQKKWLPIIEDILKKQKLPHELSRVFLVPSNSSLEETTPPWTRLAPKIVDRYLLKNSAIDENRSPLKVARVLATVFKKQLPTQIHWNNYFKSPTNMDAAFFAALYADTYRDELLLERKDPPKRTKVKAFKLYRETSVGELVQQLKLDLPLFFENNPDLLQKGRQVVLPKMYVFFLTK